MSAKTNFTDTDLNINSIFEDPRDFLTEEKIATTNNLNYQCPQIKIMIENIKVEALIDTGSKISGISESLYNKHKTEFKKCEKLPLPNLTAIGFTGEKSQKLKIQICSFVQFNSLKLKCNFIIIPKLIKECIIGIDLLNILCATVDLKNNTLKIQYNKKNESINFIYKNYISQDKKAMNNLYSSVEYAQAEIDTEGEHKSTQDIPSEEDIEKKTQFPITSPNMSDIN